MLTRRWVFPAVPAAVPAARRAVCDVAERRGAEASLLASVALCISEAVTNVVVHAYRHDPAPGAVMVEARSAVGALELSVRDEGCGMAPRPDSPGAGLGLGLIAQCASRLAVRRVAARGTRVDMAFDLSG